jgi:hypothetical protein
MTFWSGLFNDALSLEIASNETLQQLMHVGKIVVWELEGETEIHGEHQSQSHAHNHGSHMTWPAAVTTQPEHVWTWGHLAIARYLTPTWTQGTFNFFEVLMPQESLIALQVLSKGTGYVKSNVTPVTGRGGL